MKAGSDVEPGPSDACVNVRTGKAGQAQAFISTEDR